MENNQAKKVNPRSLSSILTFSMMICLFVTFCIGTICYSTVYKYEGIDISLNWSVCAPYLVFGIIALILATCKFFLCTLNLKKEYPSKDTIKFQFILELIGLLVLLFLCISIVFIKGDNINNEIIATILTSSLGFGIQIACSGLAYHNYK